MLTNLHMADSNRCALGEGSLDLDTIIMALYLIGYNRRRLLRHARAAGPRRRPLPGHVRPARPGNPRPRW